MLCNEALKHVSQGMKHNPWHGWIKKQPVVIRVRNLSLGLQRCCFGRYMLKMLLLWMTKTYWAWSLSKNDTWQSLKVDQAAGEHTWYLSFLLHRQHFRIKNFTPKNRLKTPQNTQKCPWKVKYIQFLCSIWKILHLTEYFYTGTAHGARNNYQVRLHARYICVIGKDLTWVPYV